MSNLLQKIADHPVYKQVMSDSMGGIMYDVSKRGTYDTSELLPMMAEAQGMDGIMLGAYNFLKGE